MKIAVAIGLGVLVVVPSAPAATQPSSVRFARPSVAFVSPTSDGAVYQVRFRTTQTLRSDRQGIRAEVKLAGAGADSTAVPFGNRSHHCYAAVIGDDFATPGLRDARPGTPLLLTLRYAGRTVRQTVTLRSQRGADISSLSCGRR